MTGLAMVVAFKRLPAAKKQRVALLHEMLEKSEDLNEQLEIALAIVEILAPQKVGGERFAIEAGLEAVDPAARSFVEGYHNNIAQALKADIKAWREGYYS